MAGHISVQIHRIIKCNFNILFIFVVVFAVNGSVRIRYDDVRLRMIETFTRNKFDAINQSDIEILKSMMLKTVKRGRTFQYMWKLHEAMQRETNRLDFAEDYSSKDWVIKAFRPATYDEDTVTFTNCTLCNRTRYETRCNVTRIELLLPLMHTNAENKTTNDVIYLEINRYTINNSNGTVNVSGAVIFDLTHILHKFEDISSGDFLKIKIKRPPCRYVFPNRSMLYEYCNINGTILDRFWTNKHKEKKKNLDLQRNDHEDAELQSNKNRNIVDATEASGEEPEKTEITDELEETWTVLDGAKGIDGEDEITYSNPLILGAIGSTSPSNTENYRKNQRSNTVVQDRKVRSPLGELVVVSQHLKTEELSEHQPRLLKSTRKPHKAKRHLGNPVVRDQAIGQQDDDYVIKPDRLTGECKRHSFYVSFQVHMNRWDIVIPDNLIDIGFCSSSCRHANHFSNVRDYLTAHAVIVNSIRGKTPAVSCSPHKMSTISILKMNHLDMSFAVENLLNAKVESCWCT